MDTQSTQQEGDRQYATPDAEYSTQGSTSDRYDDIDPLPTAHNPPPDDETSSTEPVAVQTSAGLDDPDIPQSLDAFLQLVERRAFVMARYALRNDADALDAVQDAMLKLCESYGERPCNEWGPLFHRILHNGIADRHRPRGMNRLQRWMGRASNAASEPSEGLPEHDLMDSLPSESPGPQDELVAMQRSTRINDALSLLSSQQREVFLLRRWQGLSVRETAMAMNIGEGSVKTHLSRAVAALRERLQENET